MDEVEDGMPHAENVTDTKRRRRRMGQDEGETGPISQMICCLSSSGSLLLSPPLSHCFFA